jgi:hypothetical protein
MGDPRKGLRCEPPPLILKHTLRKFGEPIHTVRGRVDAFRATIPVALWEQQLEPTAFGAAVRRGSIAFVSQARN